MLTLHYSVARTLQGERERQYVRVSGAGHGRPATRRGRRFRSRSSAAPPDTRRELTLLEGGATANPWVRFELAKAIADQDVTGHGHEQDGEIGDGVAEDAHRFLTRGPVAAGQVP
jgi:hypothetical protein